MNLGQKLECVPVFALTYGISGLLYSTRRADKVCGTVVRSLGCVFVLIAILNGYVECWASYRRVLNFRIVIIFLVIALVLGYANFVISLFELSFRQNRNKAVLSTYLLIVALLVVGIGSASSQLMRLENPPLGFFSFLAAVFLVHVPLLLMGRSQMIQAADTVKLDRDPALSHQQRRMLLLLTTAPLIAALIIQIVTRRDDWRLFFLDSTTTLAFVCLVNIATRSTR